MKYAKGFPIIVIIVLINIVLTGFLEITIRRPIIYYEYIFLPILLIVVDKNIYRTIILIGLILLDIVYNLSHLYFFDIFNYIGKIPYLYIAKFNYSFWILILISLCILFWLCKFLIKIFDLKLKTLQDEKLKINIVLSVSFFIMVYIIDSLNGTSLIGEKDKGKHIINITTENKKEYNVGKSLIKELYNDYKFFQLGKKELYEIADFKNINSDSSFSYKYFYNSDGNKEVVIVLESWGLLLNNELLKDQIAPFYKIDSSKYKITFEKSYFNGATLQAESRELLNKVGEAYFSVINHNKCDIKNLIKKKADQDYTTMAVQPFDGTYSVGAKFKKLIGFEIFRDYKFFHDTLGLKTIFNNQYQSVLDEEVFAYIFENLKKSKKNFTYCLTINTHLPFFLTKEQKDDTNFINFREIYKNKFPNEEMLGMYYRMNQELKSIANLISMSDVDKVLIIGDHAPPYIFKNERNFFAPYYVPSILIEKKN
jgi:hypothetical protein